MGLDGVELIMDVEKRFCISIPDTISQYILTPGELHLYVLGRLQGELACCSQAEGPAFSEHDLRTNTERVLRWSLASQLNIDEKVITSDSSLEKLIPKKNRRKIWADLGKNTAMSVPPLERSDWVMGWNFVLGVLSWLVIAINYPIFVTIVVGLLLIKIIAWATRPLAREFPALIQTLGDLADYNLRNQDPRLILRAGGDIWPIIQTMVVEHLGVKREKVTRSARFVEDLGMS